MIKAELTPNHIGIAVSGDFHDFEQLYEAIHELIPDEGSEDIDYHYPNLRALGFCYDLRHAMMGHRDIFLVDHGMSEETLRYHEIVTSPRNLYLSFPTLVPEMLFVLMVLRHYTNSPRERPSRTMLDYHSAVAIVNHFDNAVMQCFRQVLTERKFINTSRSIQAGSHVLARYLTLYLDKINLDYFELEQDERTDKISIYAKRLGERGRDYEKIEREIREAAKQHGVRPEQIRYTQSFPDIIEW
ncbi:DUF6904 family protein [Salisediminibacterium selenitireducens]|uniref:Uncharacterized protein n=1 Tax=Bacillus selenitireducens (strain ATCC 700615 / DSM 15326 / MLS10) TaxID=439292 RepID=D6XWG7_BACIE|nr:hypothetical protein [Salisediminibacterium selenitireducens]ADH97809.1 hypothetical protein Bsel_0267 [[Bacillus] selenitireducens MLS10]